MELMTEWVQCPALGPSTELCRGPQHRALPWAPVKRINRKPVTDPQMLLNPERQKHFYGQLINRSNWSGDVFSSEETWQNPNLLLNSVVGLFVFVVFVFVVFVFVLLSVPSATGRNAASVSAII